MNEEAFQEFVYSQSARTSRRNGVVRSGDQERDLDQRREQNVTEHVNHVGWQPPRGGDQLETLFEASEAMAFVDFAPLLPADDRVGIDENTDGLYHHPTRDRQTV
jgi:hypothetical protein